MIEQDGKDNNDNQHWKLYVPDEHCKAGLEVTITESDKGINIGNGFIPWEHFKAWNQRIKETD